jgi:hypothetical protein
MLPENAPLNSYRIPDGTKFRKRSPLFTSVLFKERS